MSQQVDDVKKFVKGFMTNLLIPLAADGILNEELMLECVEVYAQELTSKSAKANTLEIKSDNDYKALHPYYMSEFMHDDIQWLSLEHYFQAVKYMDGGDESVAENIISAQSAELAHRRGANASEQKKSTRHNWTKVRGILYEEGIRSMIEQNEIARSTLIATQDSMIFYPHPTNSFLGIFPDGKGENVYGKILSTIRSTL